MTLQAYTIICLSKSLLSEKNIFGYLIQKQQFVKNIMKIITKYYEESLVSKEICLVSDKESNDDDNDVIDKGVFQLEKLCNLMDCRVH